MPKSFKGEVIADNSGKWCSNAARFATHEEANEAVKELESRWVSVRETRVVESDEEVNFYFDKTIYKARPISEKVN